MNNAQIADVFENIAGLLEMKGDSVFTVRAYQRAVRTIGHHPIELEQLVLEGGDLREIPGIGRAFSDKITELVNTNDLDYYRRLKAEFPDGILDVMRVPGVGPKTTSRLWKELGISSVSDLERAIEDGRLAALPRMGKKTADNILREIQADRSKDQRIPISRALPAAERVCAALTQQCPSITRLVVAGSLRRFEETVGDIDLVCTAGEPQHVLDTFVDLPNVVQVLGHGSTKASVLLSEEVQVDLRVVAESSFGALLQYFTGSKQHNILLREYAGRLGLSLNEYGITEVETGRVHEFDDEESFYGKLGLRYIAPELRQGIGEIERARDGSLPGLVEVGDIKGDLHAHTDWTDGRDSMEVMVAGAKEKGYQYIAITDHSVGRGIANGLSLERLERHMTALHEVETAVGGIQVLCGSEVDIRADGTLDYPDDVLRQLDWVVASVHSAMGQESERMTERIIAAMSNPHVTVIGHLTTRLIGERRPIAADFEAIFRAAVETGTALELNSSLQRLDLKDSHVHRARELGVPLVISSDAHTVETLDNPRYGVAVARRGWCEPGHILNTLPFESFMSFLTLEKGRRSKEFASYA